MSSDEVAGITVMLAFDANYAQHGAACMASLLRHTPGRFHFLVVSAGDPAPFAARLLRSFAGEPRATIDIRRFTPPPGTRFPLPAKLTLETYLRFWIGDLLPESGRALYIDADAIATTSVAPLWETDLQGRVLAAVPIPGSTRPATHGMPPGSPFFNAGLLLVDLDAWRARDYCGRCLAYLRAHPERALDGDQDILNLCTIGDWLELPYEWNVISPFYRPSHDLQLPPAVVARVRRDAKIVHYNGANKPWSYLDQHPRKRDYLVNLAATEWRDVRPRDYTALNVVRKHVQGLLPARFKAAVRRVVRVGGRWMGRSLAVGSLAVGSLAAGSLAAGGLAAGGLGL